MMSSGIYCKPQIAFSSSSPYYRTEVSRNCTTMTMVLLKDFENWTLLLLLFHQTQAQNNFRKTSWWGAKSWKFSKVPPLTVTIRQGNPCAEHHEPNTAPIVSFYFWNIDHGTNLQMLDGRLENDTPRVRKGGEEPVVHLLQESPIATFLDSTQQQLPQ